MEASLVLIPLIAGVIGYVTNYVGVKMLFFPVRFRGISVPGLAGLATILPRKLQQVPGVIQGGIGWQGVIPSRAAKMGSIAVDKGIAKLGSPAEFYDQLEPARIAEHILANARTEIRELVERTLEREHPRLWRDTPKAIREAIHARVQQQLPQIVHDVTQDIGRNIDQLLDIKLMVISHIERDPRLANRIFLEVGDRELRFVVNSGFLFGVLLGIPTIGLFQIITAWWLLPVAGIVIGYLTNWIAIKMIFLPVRPRRIGPVRIQGLFIKRQPEVSDVYAAIIAEDIITLANIGNELLHGPRSDRTRQMIARSLRPAIDDAVGPARAAVRVALGSAEYDRIRASVATEAVDHTMTPLTDPAFNEQQSVRIHRLIRSRMLELPPDDYAEMLRSAIVEDEWMLILIGSVLGFVAGCLQLLTV